MEVMSLGDNRLGIKLPYDPINIARAKNIPERRYDAKNSTWVFKALMANMEYVKNVFPGAKWTPEAEAIYKAEVAKRDFRNQVARGEIDTSDQLEGIPMKMKPFDHQRKALVMGRDLSAFAYLMDQGTGKTKVQLDDAAHNFRCGLIDCLIILAPNSVKTNWVNTEPDPLEPDEVDKHMAPDIPFVKACWFSNPTRDQRIDWDRAWAQLENKSILKIFAFNIEAIRVPRVKKTLLMIAEKTNAMITCDEATRIKNRTSNRAKAAKEVRKECMLARIMSGTPIIKSPLDIYSQFEFLDPSILGFATFTSFKNHYAVTGGWNGTQALYYKNQEELSERIAGVCFRITKDKCLDLPPKVYTKRYIKMTDQQAHHYNNMREELITWLDEHHNVQATVVLTQLLRLQQIVAGHLPIIDPITKEMKGTQPICDPSPKVDEACNIIEECEHKVIVWCKFTFEVEQMILELEKRGIRAVRFDGKISDSDRIKARSSFQTDPNVKTFVGEVSTGGIGITLNAAGTVIYLSNTFSTENRVQSEDRAHRIGQTLSVQYIDLLCKGTVDIKVIQTLRANKEISDVIMRDGWKEWI